MTFVPARTAKLDYTSDGNSATYYVQKSFRSDKGKLILWIATKSQPIPVLIYNPEPTKIRKRQEKYKDFNFPDNLALPVLPNQLMNRYLKKICEYVGFNQPITRIAYKGGERVEETKPKCEMIGTHAGRRTFICFALASGIPPQVVMKWTGHSDYQAMKPYIAIAEKTKADAMKLFDEELKK